MKEPSTHPAEAPKVLLPRQSTDVPDQEASLDDFMNDQDEGEKMSAEDTAAAIAMEEEVDAALDRYVNFAFTFDLNRIGARRLDWRQLNSIALHQATRQKESHIQTFTQYLISLFGFERDWYPSSRLEPVHLPYHSTIAF